MTAEQPHCYMVDVLVTGDACVKEGGPALEELLVWPWVEMITVQWNEEAQCQK